MAHSAEMQSASPAAPQPFAPQPSVSATQENFSDYVAELQLHMALQARNLVPSLHQQTSRSALLHETQALVEKQISRQV